MKMRDVHALAAQLYDSDEFVGWVRRARKSPRFVVGRTNLASARSEVLGTSDVDWESAFYVATGGH